jgi:ABC-type sulfate transport system permease subunit
MTEPVTSPPRRVGRSPLLFALIGAVLVPAAIFIGVQHFDPLCGGDGGGEARIACTLKSLALTAMAIPVGVVAGVLMAWLINRKLGARRV